MNRITVDANNPTVKTILLQLNKFLNLRKKIHKTRIQKTGLLPLVLLSVLLLNISSMSVVAQEQGVALATDLLGGFGTVTELIKTEVDKVLLDTGLDAAALQAQTALTDLAEGNVPVISDLTDPFQGDVDGAITDALNKAQLATQIMSNIAGPAALEALRLLADSPLFYEADFGITLPTGRLNLSKRQ